MNLWNIIDALYKNQTLEREEFIFLLKNRTEESAGRLADLAREEAQKIYGKKVFPRGLIEFTNYCRNNCYYCGIQASNPNISRYRLSEDQILNACQNGYDLGYRSFVLQGGEDPYFSDDRMVPVVEAVHTAFPDCAITLSLGERSLESYQRLHAAGGRRYLLRHETISPVLYGRLHPESMSLKHRVQCLYDLREAGFQIGTGFMVGAPGQTLEDLADDLLFIRELHPQMVGIGPFVPHHDTRFRDFPSGTAELTIYLISILRLMDHHLLLPSTTALGTIDPNGREKGILAGANVVMPNLSPTDVRKDYALYDNKICTGDEAAECRQCLERRMNGIGYQIAVTRGDSLNL